MRAYKCDVFGTRQDGYARLTLLGWMKIQRQELCDQCTGCVLAALSTRQQKDPQTEVPE